jgi:hypothetical protein
MQALQQNASLLKGPAVRSRCNMIVTVCWQQKDSHYTNLHITSSLLPCCIQLWAMLMYFDEVVGRLVEYVENSPTLRGNTYIMIAGKPLRFLCMMQ